MTPGPRVIRPARPDGVPWQHMSAIEIMAAILTGAVVQPLSGTDEGDRT